jgi:RimJ/RimL family protein N-acetyltransferase
LTTACLLSRISATELGGCANPAQECGDDEPGGTTEAGISGSETKRGVIQMLKGKRVLLRPFRRSDISYFLKWFNDPEVVQYLDMYLPMTEMSEERFIEEVGTTKAMSEVLFVFEAIEGDSMRRIGHR